MQKRHTLQRAAARSEQPSSGAESNESGPRIKRAEQERDEPGDSEAAEPHRERARVIELSLPPSSPETLGAVKPSRWLAPIALTLGLVCLGLAFWLQLH